MTADGVDVVWVVVWTVTEFGDVCASAGPLPANANQSGSAASERREQNTRHVLDIWRVRDIRSSGDMGLAIERGAASSRQLCQWPATQT